MHKALVLLTICFFLGAIAEERVVVASANNGEFRALEVTRTAKAVAIAGAKLDLSKSSGTTSDTTVSGKLDAAKFVFAANGDNVGFYLGVIDASGSATFSKNTAIASVQATAAEIVAGFSHILVWYNFNNQIGLQYSPGDHLWKCDSTSTEYDCVDTTLSLSFKDHLTFSDISVSSAACPAGSGYESNCTVYTLSTTGYLLLNPTVPVIKFDFMLANQAVLIGANQINPDKAKIDITITYPWSSMPTPKFQAPRLSLLCGAAGKLVSGKKTHTVTAQNSGGEVSFVGSSSGSVSRAGVFTWIGEAKVGTENSEVIVATATGQQFKDAQCTSVDCNPLFLAGIKIIVGIWEAFGWDTTLVWFSWNDIQPESIIWDPAVETVQSGGISVGGSAALFIPLFVLYFLLK